MVGRPLGPVGAPEAVRPDVDPATVVEVVATDPAAVEAVVDEPVPDEVSPEEVVEVAPRVAELDADEAEVVDVVVLAGLVEVVVDDDVVVAPADTPGFPDP